MELSKITPPHLVTKELDRTTETNFRRTFIEIEFKPFAENSESIRNFHMRFQEWCELYQMSDPEKLSFLPLFLENSASDVFRELSPTEKCSIESVFKALHNHFNPPYLRPYKMLAINKLKMSESDDINAFMTNFISKCRDIEMSDQKIMDAILPNFTPSISKYLFLERPQNLQQLREKARIKNAALKLFKSQETSSKTTDPEIVKTLNLFYEVLSNLNDKLKEFQTKMTEKEKCHENFKNIRNRDCGQNFWNQSTLQNNQSKWSYSKNSPKHNKMRNKAKPSKIQFCEVSTQTKRNTINEVVSNQTEKYNLKLDKNTNSAKEVKMPGVENAGSKIDNSRRSREKLPKIHKSASPNDQFQAFIRNLQKQTSKNIMTQNKAKRKLSQRHIFQRDQKGLQTKVIFPFVQKNLNCIIDRNVLRSCINCKVFSAQKWKAYEDFVQIKLKIDKSIKKHRFSIIQDMNAPEIVLGKDFIEKFSMKTKTNFKIPNIVKNKETVSNSQGTSCLKEQKFDKDITLERSTKSKQKSIESSPKSSEKNLLEKKMENTTFGLSLKFLCNLNKFYNLKDIKRALQFIYKAILILCILTALTCLPRSKEHLDKRDLDLGAEFLRKPLEYRKSFKHWGPLNSLPLTWRILSFIDDDPKYRRRKKTNISEPSIAMHRN